MIPKKLVKGDTIGIIAPSNPILPDRKTLLDNAVKKLESLGLNIVFSKNMFKFDKYKVSAGEPQERADDLNAMFKDPKIKAIYSFQGGNTANQILDLIDYNAIKKNPKIFFGMSDIDVLHLAINTKTGLISFNSSDPKSGRNLDLDLDYTWNSFKERMFNKSKVILASLERTCVREGTAEGKVLGCNIFSILKLSGTDYFPDFTDSILFLESYKCNTQQIIWKLEQLKQLGVFDKIKGIVIGYILSFQDKELRKEQNINCNFEDLVLDITKDYDFPILKTNDFGHYCPNCFLPIGARVKLDATNKTLEITEEFLE